MESVNSTTDTVVTNNQVVDIHRELMQLGLNDKQAELYLLLVKHKELRIQEIVNLSQLPRSSVYEHLNKLYKFGIAEEIVENNYKKIRAYPISSIGHNLNEEIQKLKRMSDNLGALEKTINLNISKHNDDLASVRYYRDRAGARQIYWNSLKAKNTVYVYSEWGRSKYVGKKFYEDFVSINLNG
jgi:sugar-specific transcriptional regulator TrmB